MLPITVLIQSFHSLSRIGSRRATQVFDLITTENMQIYKIIRSVESNQGKIFNTLGKEIPILHEPGIWDEIVKVIENAFQDGPERNVVNKYASGNL